MHGENVDSVRKIVVADGGTSRLDGENQEANGSNAGMRFSSLAAMRAAPEDPYVSQNQQAFSGQPKKVSSRVGSG